MVRRANLRRPGGGERIARSVFLIMRRSDGGRSTVAAHRRLVRRLQGRVPCGCTFAQAPDEGQCDGILAWHVREETTATSRWTG